MSCYFRHMKDLLEEAGVNVTDKNKKDVDRVIHSLADVEYKDCSWTWKKIKEQIGKDPKERELFIQKLKEALRGA